MHWWCWYVARLVTDPLLFCHRFHALVWWRGSDGVPSYELAVVVDDLTMGVTEVGTSPTLLTTITPHPTYPHTPHPTPTPHTPSFHGRLVSL